MSVGSVLICLSASRSDGLGVTTAEFLAPLAIATGEVEATRADAGEWSSATVFFAVVRHRDYDHVDKSADAGAQCIAFEAGIAEAFQRVARFLDLRPPSVSAAMRNAGLTLQLLVEIRMDQDQMELEFPAELLIACGRHKLGVYVISNDIPAAEVLASMQLGTDAPS